MRVFNRTFRRAALLLLALPIVAFFARETSGQGEAEPDELFATSDRCQACHNRLVAENGYDLSIGASWRATMMAHSASDPYWLAGVRREVTDHPLARAAIEDKCATCHMPMARFMSVKEGKQGRVLDDGAACGESNEKPHAAHARDGVSCSLCHQIRANNLGKKESFTGGFLVDTARPAGQREAFGPFAIAAGTQGVMRSATGFVPRAAGHIRDARLCATCHTLYTHTLDKNGNEVGKLPEQVPYLEWLQSDYADIESCQDCHMEAVSGERAVSSVLGLPRDGLSKHVFRGGNFFMLGMMNRNRTAVAIQAEPSELATSIQNTKRNLESDTAAIRLAHDPAAGQQGCLAIEVRLENLAGHKLPTAYPSRRVWIQLIVEDGAELKVFESGALRRDGSIAGNDNDLDPARCEPHHTSITSPAQVQIYEAIMKRPDGSITTGLLQASGYLKDNRLLPSGFDKLRADPDVAVHGAALSDPDFAGGGDSLVYCVDVRQFRPPFKVTAHLWYQSIGYRWAKNLASYDAEEPRGFIAMYDAFPRSESATVLSGSSISIDLQPAGDESPATDGQRPSEDKVQDTE